jgi:chemotaxis protein histidine kinase CheA
LTEYEAIDLIFLPQFSTKSVATEISGRGVGLTRLSLPLKKRAEK